MATLDTAFEEILDAIVAAIKEETPAGGTLEGIQEVVRGDRARPMPALPAIWVVPSEMQNLQTTFGVEEEWTLPIALAGMVKDDDVEAGSRACARYAALARAAVVKEPQLGLDYVIDTTSLRFDGASRTNERNRTIHWADATIQVKFSVTF